MYASALLHILKIFPKVIDLRKLRCQGGVQFVEQGRQVSPNNWCALPSPPRWLNGESSKSSGSMLMAVAMWSRIKSSHASCSALNLTPAFALSMSHSLNRSDTESAKGARMVVVPAQSGRARRVASIFSPSFFFRGHAVCPRIFSAAVQSWASKLRPESLGWFWLFPLAIRILLRCYADG